MNNFDITSDEWKNTPDSVKNYINELHTSIKRLQAELNKYIQYAEKNSPKETLSFNGLSDFIRTPFPIEITTNQFTFEAKVYVKNRSGPYSFLHIYGPQQLEFGTNWVEGPPKNVAWLGYQWGGCAVGGIDDKGVFHAIHTSHHVSGDIHPPKCYLDGYDSVPVNEWHHVLGCWDNGKEIRLYLDGELVNSQKFDAKIELATHCYIGCHYGATHSFLPGQLDNVRIYDKALDEEEIQLHSSGGMIEDDEHLIINYSATKKPVLVGDFPELGKVDTLEQEIGDMVEELPSAQKSLIEDLKSHLNDLNKKRSEL